LSDDVKRRFWENLDDMVRGVSSSEKLFIGGDLNGRVDTIRRGLRGYMEVLDMTNKIKRENIS
jgi:hypothetical protein